MNRLLLFLASESVLGGVFASVGLSNVVAGTPGIAAVLFSLAGVGMVLSAAYDAFVADDPSRSVPEGRALWTVVGLTAVGVVGLLWSAFA